MPAEHIARIFDKRGFAGLFLLVIQGIAVQRVTAMPCLFVLKRSPPQDGNVPLPELLPRRLYAPVRRGG
ncbi:hypothetical protein KL86PLE_100341 [uncultured Pleomorphomonas sp.]|uniref:Uncharacterized protein n=1 Tax=uncultured Pleomorphomonas sp. TaxID=442121 RepID=A0A212L2L0_9HYPH|nr:hypothetical protein KL86PLE_100341 [uncultured Pleomorphomonas sp.]